MITYRTFNSALLEQVKGIYAAAGWSAYLNDDEKLRRAFDQSLFLLGAFDGETLAGFARCVGDGEHILLVQDLIVSPVYQRQGIGTSLFRTVWKKYADVRMFQVVTDIYDPVDNRFYRSFGMKTLAEGDMAAYFR